MPEAALCTPQSLDMVATNVSSGSASAVSFPRALQA
jgi:hypothetical protein